MDVVNGLIWGMGVIVGGAAAFTAIVGFFATRGSIRKKLMAQSTAVVDEAEEAAVLRRVYFDTLGFRNHLAAAGMEKAHADAITEATHQAIRESALMIR